MRLSIIIVSWNVRKDLMGCIRSIRKKSQPVSYEIIVVDNKSSDGTSASLKNEFPDVILIQNKENRGFAAANNQGIERSKGEYILLLNPDTLVHPFSLDILVKFMDNNKDVGACGPKLLNRDDTLQPSARRFPSFRGVLYRHTVFRSLRIFRGQYKRWLMKDFKYDRRKDVDQLMGSALMVRRSVLQDMGGMDETFFMYYEEVDLCYRIKQAGWRIVFIPEAIITHFGGRSSSQIPVRKRIMMLTSLLKFLRKYNNNIAVCFFCCVFKPAILAGEVTLIVSGTIKYVLAIIAFNEKRREKSKDKIKHAASFLGNHSLDLLFKM